MRVNVVSYLFHEADPGGGGMIRQALMAEGVHRGHELEFSHVQPRPQIRTHADPDIWILADVWNLAWHWKRLHRRIWSRIPWSAVARYKQVITMARKSEKFVHLDNAYVDVCDLPYLPCNGLVSGTDCPFKTGLGAKQRECHRMTSESLYHGSRLNFYLSPQHASVIERLLGLTSERTHIINPIISTDLFIQGPRASVRDIPLLFVGPFNEAQGSTEIMRRWPHGEVRVVGPRTKEAASYPGYAGAAPYSQIPSLMSRTRTFVFHPRWPEPFGRVVAEAALSGCALDTNDRVGALSFGVDLSDPTSYEDSCTKFWLTLESLTS